MSRPTRRQTEAWTALWAESKEQAQAVRDQLGVKPPRKQARTRPQAGAFF